MVSYLDFISESKYKIYIINFYLEFCLSLWSALLYILNPSKSFNFLMFLPQQKLVMEQLYSVLKHIVRENFPIKLSHNSFL